MYRFEYGRVVSKIITEIIRANYTDVWLDWGEVKKAGNGMWNQFRVSIFATYNGI